MSVVPNNGHLRGPDEPGLDGVGSADRDPAQAMGWLRAIVASSDDAIIGKTLEGQILTWNPGAERIFGYTAREAVGRNICMLIPPERLEEEETVLRRIRNGEVVDHYRTERLRKDGRRIEVLLSVSPIKDGGGQIIGAAKIARDVTEHALARGRIEFLDRVRAVLGEVNRILLREKDPQKVLELACRIAVEKGQFRMAWAGRLDEAAQRLVPVASAGATEGYLEVLDIDLRHPARSLGPAARALAQGAHAVCNDIEHDPAFPPWRDEAVRRGYRAVAAFPLKVDGRGVGALALYAAEPGFFDFQELDVLDEMASDVSLALETEAHEAERLRAQEALRTSEAWFRSLMENASDLIGVLNDQGIIRLQSPSSEQYLGYTAQEMTGRNAFDFIHPDDRARAAEALQRALAHPETPVTTELRLRHRDGGWRILQGVGRLLPNQAGEKLILLNSRDVTERREEEERSRQAQKMEAIGELAGGVAHDFNNILAAMFIHLGLLQQSPQLTAGTKEALKEIEYAAMKAANLTRQLLLFSRREVAKFEPLDVQAVAADLLKMLRRLLGENIEISFQRVAAPVWVKADAGMLEQVIMNLCINARDAMPQGGKLTLGASLVERDGASDASHPDARPGRFACLAVADTGCGMNQAVLKRIFEPFFTTKPAGKGTGLGLATVHGIMKKHAGWVEVESAIGQGSTFRAYFPAVAEPAEKADAAAGADRARGGSETILLVEDDLHLRRMAVLSLRLLGYAVLEAADGEEALKVWNERRQRVHLLLTDLVMPKAMNGLDLAHRLKGEDAGLRVVVCSGYSNDVPNLHLLGEEAAFLAKPFKPATLAKVIRECLDQT